MREELFAKVTVRGSRGEYKKLAQSGTYRKQRERRKEKVKKQKEVEHGEPSAFFNVLLASLSPFFPSWCYLQEEKMPSWAWILTSRGLHAQRSWKKVAAVKKHGWYGSNEGDEESEALMGCTGTQDYYLRERWEKTVNIVAKTKSMSNGSMLVDS